MAKKYMDSKDYCGDLYSVDSYAFVGKANIDNPGDKFTAEECLFTAANKARSISNKLEKESSRYPKERKRYESLIKDLRKREAYYRSLSDGNVKIHKNTKPKFGRKNKSGQR